MTNLHSPSSAGSVDVPLPDRLRSEADKQDIWDAWSVVDAFGRETTLDSTDGHAAIVHAIRYGRYGAKPTRVGFERLLESLKYDGGDINSLTVGEIRRALP